MEQQLAAATARVGVAGAGLTAPLVNANVLGFNQKAFEAQAKQALAEYEQKILVAFREVEDALIAVSTSRDQRRALVEQVEATKSAP